MKNVLWIILLFLGCSGNKNEGQKVIVPSAEKIRQMAQDESLVPVRPGIPGKTPFWNTYAKRFIYAPSFDFKEFEGAREYKFIAGVDNSDQTYSFIADKPWQDISSIWANIPIGTINLKVEAIRKGKVIGIAGEKTFYKASPFKGPYQKVDQTYQESVSQLMEYLFNAPYIKYWLSNEKPDMDYGLYSYPSKMFSAVIHGMLMYSDMTKDDSQKNESIQIACNTADYLIEISQPGGSPLEYFPPTYTGPIYADMEKVYRGESLADRMMLIYPALAAGAYLDLFDKTQNQKYFDAAIRIAETYRRIQFENGS